MPQLDHGAARPAGDTSAEALIRDAQKVLTNCGVHLSPSKVSRIVRQFKRRVEGNGFPFEAFLLNSVQLTAEERRRALANPDLARVFPYHHDPTGEDAVNHVLREQEQKAHERTSTKRSTHRKLRRDETTTLPQRWRKPGHARPGSCYYGF